jgi:hypothetical protein
VADDDVRHLACHRHQVVVYGYVENVLTLRSSLNDGIERQLEGKRPLAQMRRGRP